MNRLPRSDPTSEKDNEKGLSFMRDVRDRGTWDLRAVKAVALFCYQVTKWAGVLAVLVGKGESNHEDKNSFPGAAPQD
jgi:hypothetical protein